MRAACVPVRAIPAVIEYSKAESSSRAVDVDVAPTMDTVRPCLTRRPATDCPPHSAPTAPVDTEAWWEGTLLVGVPGRNFSFVFRRRRADRIVNNLRSIVGYRVDVG